jgi:hypothetical protein
MTALTSLLLLQYIAKRFGELVGKGLPWSVIFEFLVLSLPLTIALSLPMAVLVATLYAFSRLASENEITAMKASGVSLRNVLTPVVWAAAFVTLFMVGFNDQILPRANHKLRTLQGDIAQKKPTFALREQVINEVSPGKLYLRAGRLSQTTNVMRDITITRGAARFTLIPEVWPFRLIRPTSFSRYTAGQSRMFRFRSRRSFSVFTSRLSSSECGESATNFRKRRTTATRASVRCPSARWSVMPQRAERLSLWPSRSSTTSLRSRGSEN